MGLNLGLFSGPIYGMIEACGWLVVVACLWLILGSFYGLFCGHGICHTWSRGLRVLLIEFE